MGLNLLREQFREYNLLGEILGPDDNSFRPAFAAPACKQHEQCEKTYPERPNPVFLWTNARGELEFS
jgi:hypothetical protein